MTTAPELPASLTGLPGSDTVSLLPPYGAATGTRPQLTVVPSQPLAEPLEFEDALARALHRARRTLRREYAVRGGTLPGVGLVALAPWLEGLRWAAKMRHVARRTTGAAALAASGLAIVSVAPFGAHSSHIRPSPAMRPAL